MKKSLYSHRSRLIVLICLILVLTSWVSLDAQKMKVGLSFYNVLNRQNVSYRHFDLSQSPPVITDITQPGFLPTLDLKVTLRDLRRLMGDTP